MPQGVGYTATTPGPPGQREVIQQFPPGSEVPPPVIDAAMQGQILLLEGMGADGPEMPPEQIAQLGGMSQGAPQDAGMPPEMAGPPGGMPPGMGGPPGGMPPGMAGPPGAGPPGPPGPPGPGGMPPGAPPEEMIRQMLAMQGQQGRQGGPM